MTVNAVQACVAEKEGKVSRRAGAAVGPERQSVKPPRRVRSLVDCSLAGRVVYDPHLVVGVTWGRRGEHAAC